MARPRNTPRLSEIDPEEVSNEVGLLLEGHLQRLNGSAAAAFTSVFVGPELEHLKSDFGALTRWAKNGNAQDRKKAQQVLKPMCDALFSSPIRPNGGREPQFDETKSVQLILAAATARTKLEAKKPVTGPQLAALAGVNRSRIRQLIKAGVLRRTKVVQRGSRQMDAPIIPSDALKLIGSREAACA